MAEIIICTLAHDPGGPNLPKPHYAYIRQEQWHGGKMHDVLCLRLGADEIKVWPVVSEHLEALGKKLIELADKK